MNNKGADQTVRIRLFANPEDKFSCVKAHMCDKSYIQHLVLPKV